MTPAIPTHQREYTITLAYHLREFLIFALDRWIEQGLNKEEAACIRAGLLKDEGHQPVFDVLKGQIAGLTHENGVQQQRITQLEAALIECFDAAIPQAMPWTGTPSEKATYVAKTLAQRIRGEKRMLEGKVERLEAALREAGKSEISRTIP